MIRRTLPPSGNEALDSPRCDPVVARATLRDIAIANTLFGGRSAVAYGLARLVAGQQFPRTLAVLDVGAGMGDVSRWIAHRALGQRAMRVRPIALDWHREAGRLCQAQGLPAIVGDVRHLPIGPASVDVVVASQVLHHFPRETVVRLIGQFDRLARVGVVIADLEPRALAAVGIWVASFALAFHRASRRDGVTSVRRGFAVEELAGLLAEAGLEATVHRRPGYRVVAVWETRSANA